MNELDIVGVFYDRLKVTGQRHDTLFISLDEEVVKELELKLNEKVTLAELHRYADICLANEWLERTTIDPEYRFLSLTKAGLKIAIANQYEKNKDFPNELV